MFRPADGPLSWWESGGETRGGTLTRPPRMRSVVNVSRAKQKNAVFSLMSAKLIMTIKTVTCNIFQHRAYLAKMQPIWDAEKAAAAAKANRENMIYLANATGTPIPADF